MTLRKSLVRDVDFLLVSTTLWQQLQSWFKGGPAIRIFITGGEPDLEPVMIKVNDEGKEKGVLMSLKISDVLLKDYIAEIMNYPSTEIEVKFKIKDDSSEQELPCGNKSLSYYNIREASTITIAEKVYTDSTIEEDKDFALTEEEMLYRAIQASLNVQQPNIAATPSSRERHGPLNIQIDNEDEKKHNGRPKTPSTGESTPTWRRKAPTASLPVNNYQYLSNMIKQ